MINIARFILPLFFMVCGIFVFGLNTHSGYNYLFLHPLIYSISFFTILYKCLYIKPFRPFLFVFTLIGFLRYVLLPVFIVISGHYSGRSPAEPLDSSYQNAILLMSWELIACTFFIIFLENRQRFYIRNFNVEFIKNKNNYIYFLFIFCAFGLLLVNPKALLYINFITPSILESDIQADFVTNLTVYFFLIAKVILVLIILEKCKKINNTYTYVIAIVAITVNIMVFWGTNKSDILIAGLASVLVFHRIYGDKSIKMLLVLGILTLSIMSFVNSERNPQTISGGTDEWVDRTDKVQIYTGGVYNVAIALETKDYYPESTELEVLVFDIFRPMIGPNILLKDKVQNYSNIYFNDRIWTNVDRRSQIIPMVGQANLFLGYIFAPLFSMVFIFIAYKLERIYLFTKNIEVYYFVSLGLIRLGFIFGQNTMNMINDLSMNLFLFYIIYLANKYFSRVMRS